MSNDLIAKRKGFMDFSCLDTAERSAMILSKSNLTPKAYQGKPYDILVAVQLGMEVGLNPSQSLQNISCINGVPSIWGDAALALCQASGVLEDIVETYDEATKTATCKAKRIGQTETVCSFSMAQAERAKLLGKGCWPTYPERMLQMRARGFALRDRFPDILKGLIFREEAEDYAVDITPTTKQIKPLSIQPDSVGTLKQEDVKYLESLKVKPPISEETKKQLDMLLECYVSDENKIKAFEMKKIADTSELCEADALVWIEKIKAKYEPEPIVEVVAEVGNE